MEAFFEDRDIRVFCGLCHYWKICRLIVFERVEMNIGFPGMGKSPRSASVAAFSFDVAMSTEPYRD